MKRNTRGRFIKDSKYPGWIQNGLKHDKVKASKKVEEPNVWDVINLAFEVTIMTAKLLFIRFQVLLLGWKIKLISLVIKERKKECLK